MFFTEKLRTNPRGFSLDFSPRATRLVKKITKKLVDNQTKNVAKSTVRYSWHKRFSTRAKGPRDTWLRAYIPADSFEGGYTLPTQEVDKGLRSGLRAIKRQISVYRFTNKLKVGFSDTNNSLFRQNSLLSNVYLRRFKDKHLERFFRKLKVSTTKRKNRWFAARRKIRSSKVNTPLGFFRRKINKLVGVWFLRRRRRVRRKFRLLIGAGTRTSRFGLWVNTTKVFKELKSVVCRKYSEYTQRAMLLAKKVTYPDYGSGILRAVLGYGRVDYGTYKDGVQYYNNKAKLGSLTDYFLYSNSRQYVLPTVLYQESSFEDVEQNQLLPITTSAKGFDLTLFESRTVFWESYVGTPTSKASFLKTDFKTIASNVLVTPVGYRQSFTTFISLLNPGNVDKQKLVGKVSGVSLNSLRKRYFRKSWRVILRLKFERFVFNRVKFPVYIWFHNIWGLFFKRFYRWRRFEHRVVSKFVAARRRNRFKTLKLRVNWFKMLIRSLGLLGLVVGSIHCFTYVFSFLMVKFRKHWQVLKLIKRYLRRCVRIHKTITGIRVVVSGRFTGYMRARKNIFKIGGKIRYMNYFRRLTYVLFNSQTPWGVFGIRMWIQFKPKRVRFVDDDMDKILKKSYAHEGLLRRKSLLRYTRQTLVELDNCGFSLKYYTNDDIDKKRHLNDLRINYAIKSSKNT